MNLKELFIKYKTLILYGIFGVLTTIINFGVYFLLYCTLTVPNTLSNIIAWILAVSFAFVTNKQYVFENKEKEAKSVIAQFMKFISCRLATGLLDLVIMFVCVDLLELNAPLFKFLSNILVIILNYSASKVFIFKSKKEAETNETFNF